MSHRDWGHPGRHGSTSVTPRLIVGLAIALFGVVLVLDRMNLAVATQVARLWPAVIIAVGALLYTQARHIGSGINGVLVMIVGAWLLLNSLGIVQVRFWELFWPLMLIVIGTALVMQSLGRRGNGEASRDDTLTVFGVLSGVKRTSTSTHFRGGEITLFMGGGQIDLREATIPPGEDAVLNVLAFMGGCEILVPPSWHIDLPIIPVMGGVDIKDAMGAPVATGGGRPPRLILRGFLMLGGIQIKSGPGSATF